VSRAVLPLGPRHCPLGKPTQKKNLELLNLRSIAVPGVLRSCWKKAIVHSHLSCVHFPFIGWFRCSFFTLVPCACVLRRSPGTPYLPALRDAGLHSFTLHIHHERLREIGRNRLRLLLAPGLVKGPNLSNTSLLPLPYSSVGSLQKLSTGLNP
jgi:hypothetical protein